MTVQEIPTEMALMQCISKAQMCQDIFRYIMQDKSLTRLQIMDYILHEAEQLTTLSTNLLDLLNAQEKARIEARNKIISSATKERQASEPVEFIDSVCKPEEPKA